MSRRSGSPRGSSSDEAWEEGRLWRVGCVGAEGIRTSGRPLVMHLDAYDSLRLAMEREPFSLETLAAVTRHLAAPIAMTNRWGEALAATLVDPPSVRRAVSSLAARLKLQVRRLPNSGMPVFALVRVVFDAWSEYALQVEDLYLSPGYPIADPHFLKLMDCGRETAFLRLSPYRSAAAALFSSSPPKQDRLVDSLLYDAARTVLQGAWHEDQAIARACAATFAMPRFEEAMELIYCINTCDLCETRNARTGRLLAFFERVYPQSAIAVFLRGLARTQEGRRVDKLPERGQRLFAQLSRAFQVLLMKTEVPWGFGRARTPLWKVVFGNLTRLSLVASRLKDEGVVKEASRRLEREAMKVIADMVESVGEVPPA